jgi:hypothetical protein
MTDYNDGKWHGWNGGECPVDPDSEIEAYYFPDAASTGHPWQFVNVAGAKHWGFPCLFRVTKPAPPKPREWWLSPDERAVVSADDPDVTFSPPWVLVREVLP